MFGMDREQNSSPKNNPLLPSSTSQSNLIISPVAAMSILLEDTAKGERFEPPEDTTVTFT